MSSDELLAEVIITVCPDLSSDVTTAAAHKTKQDKPISRSHTDTGIMPLDKDMATISLLPVPHKDSIVNSRAFSLHTPSSLCDNLHTRSFVYRAGWCEEEAPYEHSGLQMHPFVVSI
jgi:hypothetical protein